MRLIKLCNYYGGKYRVVPELKFLYPKHKRWYELFMGSGVVTLNHSRSEKEFMNDLDEGIYTLMTVLGDREKGKVLQERLFQLKYSKEMFHKAKLYKQRNFEGLDEIDQAVMVFVLLTQSFNSTRKGFSVKRYKSNTSYQRDIRYHIPRVYERLKNVKVMNRNAIDILEEIKEEEDSFVFLDPPYRESLRGKGAGNVYECELPHEEQVRLLETIKDAKCKIMLCGYKQKEGIDLYDTYLLPHGWHCYKLKDLVKSCQSKKKKDIGEEFIWVNYELPEYAKYVISMKEHRTI